MSRLSSPAHATVKEVRLADVPVYLEAIGALFPNKTVKLIAHVDGVLEKAPFDEGSLVNEGEMLFQIDPTIYRAKLEKTKAHLKSTEINLAYAKKKLERYSGLAEKEYVPQLTFEEIQNEVAGDEAATEIAKAEVELAMQEFLHCFIRAPIHGLLGEQKAGTKNYIDRGTLLSTIKQIKTLSVDFTLPEKHVLAVRAAVKVQPALPVEVTTLEGYSAAGELTFVEASVDPKTGTFLLRGSIPNEDRLLLPGVFVRVRLRIGELKEAVVIPQKALQYGQQGTFVYLATPENTAELFRVTPKQTFGEELVVEEAIPGGREVVVEGQLNLYPGAKMEIKR